MVLILFGGTQFLVTRMKPMDGSVKDIFKMEQRFTTMLTLIAYTMNMDTLQVLHWLVSANKSAQVHGRPGRLK